MEQSRIKTPASSRRRITRPWKVVTRAIKRAKSPFCVRKSRVRRVSGSSISIRTPPGQNEKTKNYEITSTIKTHRHARRPPNAFCACAAQSRFFQTRIFGRWHDVRCCGSTRGEGRRSQQERPRPRKSGDRCPEFRFHVATEHGLQEPGPNVQVSVLPGEQARLRRR